tara:strand:- start:43 stop:147 length:105 start_codon:yes stop_codon:yes gene_type:complete
MVGGFGVEMRLSRREDKWEFVGGESEIDIDFFRS